MGALPGDTVPLDESARVDAFRVDGAWRESRRYGSGHIHDTFLVRCDAGDAETRYVLQRINTRIFTDPAALSRNIERMHKHGWLAVSPDDSGRKQALTLASKGRQLLGKSLPLWKEAQSRATALLGQRGAKSIHRVGNAVWAHLARV